MMGNTLTFPSPGSSNLGDRISRWMGRWRRGGIEHYSAGETSGSSARWRADEWFTVSDERIWLDALPDAFSGLRVVQISDIHHGLFLSSGMLEQAIRQANRLNPD